jgi:phage baseplate assembly protein W
MTTSNVRRACVAAIIRWKPYMEVNSFTAKQQQQQLAGSPMEFLNQPWVNDTQGEAELLFIQRALHPGDL